MLTTPTTSPVCKPASLPSPNPTSARSYSSYMRDRITLASSSRLLPSSAGLNSEEMPSKATSSVERMPIERKAARMARSQAVREERRR